MQQACIECSGQMAALRSWVDRPYSFLWKTLQILVHVKMTKAGLLLTKTTAARPMSPKGGARTEGLDPSGDRLHSRGSSQEATAKMFGTPAAHVESHQAQNALVTRNIRLWAYIVMAYIVMAHQAQNALVTRNIQLWACIVMAYIVMAHQARNALLTCTPVTARGRIKLRVPTKTAHPATKLAAANFVTPNKNQQVQPFLGQWWLQ